MGNEERVMVFYEAPHRLLAVLEDMAEVWGCERKLAVCRELTKLFEEIKRGDIKYMLDYFTQNNPRGEFTLIVAGASKSVQEVDINQVAQELNQLIADGISRKEASKILGEKYHIKSKEVYALGLK